MEELYPLVAGYDVALQHRIVKKLAEIRIIEDDIPGVVIIHDIQNGKVVYMSRRGLDILGITLNEVAVSHPEYMARYFNPEDVENYYPQVMAVADQNNYNKLISYFQQVRASPEHEWKWYLGSLKLLMQDLDGKPLLAFAIAVPVDADHHITTKVERLIHENNFLRNHHHVFAALSKREKEILKLMAVGMNSREMAVKLFIAEKTILTHRRNIKNKLNAKSNYDITRFAQAFNMI